MLISAYLLKWKTKQTFYVFFVVSLCVFLHAWIMKLTVESVDKITSMFLTENFKIQDGFKYVLIWKDFHLSSVLEDYYTGIPYGNCSLSNCKFTKNRDLFGGDTSLFDAILFDREIKYKKDIPLKRSSSQIYVFATIESAYNFPVCKLYNENFFNWTFTYRLDSNVLWPYFVVRTLNGTKVAPNKYVKWEVSTDPIKPEIKSILHKKKKAAVWLVSHCGTDSFRDAYLTRLQEHLFHYALKIDVFGKCSKVKCPNDDCDTAIKNDYYFYMAFENSFALDFVTEKVLHGYRNYAVPVVYGGANYTRFLPLGSYIPARGVHPYNLAHMIYQAMNAQEIYEKYFTWTNLYTIQSSHIDDDNPICNFCKALNSEKVYNAPPREHFRRWWNGRNGMKWCLSDSYWNQTLKNNIDLRHVLSLYSQQP